MRASTTTLCNYRYYPRLLSQRLVKSRPRCDTSRRHERTHVPCETQRASGRALGRHIHAIINSTRLLPFGFESRARSDVLRLHLAAKPQNRATASTAMHSAIKREQRHTSSSYECLNRRKVGSTESRRRLAYTDAQLGRRAGRLGRLPGLELDRLRWCLHIKRHHRITIADHRLRATTTTATAWLAEVCQ